MVEECISGQTTGAMKENGKIIRCMARVYSLGLMAENMKGIILMIKNKVREYSHGLMEGGMMGNG